MKTEETPVDGYVVSVTGLDKSYWNETEYKDYEYFFSENDSDLSNYTASYATSSGGVTDESEASSGGQIINTPHDAVTLPETGGPGTKSIYLLGLSMIVLAGIGYMMIRCRRMV